MSVTASLATGAKYYSTIGANVSSSITPDVSRRSGEEISVIVSSRCEGGIVCCGTTPRYFNTESQDLTITGHTNSTTALRGTEHSTAHRRSL